jgi:hypothetical protein
MLSYCRTVTIICIQRGWFNLEYWYVVQMAENAWRPLEKTAFEIHESKTNLSPSAFSKLLTPHADIQRTTNSDSDVRSSHTAICNKISHSDTVHTYCRRFHRFEKHANNANTGRFMEYWKYSIVKCRASVGEPNEQALKLARWAPTMSY